MVRADRPRRHLACHALAHPSLARWVRGTRRPDRAPRRRRLCHQTGRDHVLHGRARDLRVPRLDLRSRRVDSGSRSCPRSTTATRPTSGSPRTASGPTTSSCRAWSSRRSRSGDRRRLAAHLATSPDRQFTTLDCHDGIPVRPDLDGILDPVEMQRARRSGRTPGRQRQPDPLRRGRRRALTSHQLNCTYYPPWAATTSATSRHGRSSCSRRGCRRSTTSGLLAGRERCRSRGSDGRRPRDQST